MECTDCCRYYNLTLPTIKNNVITWTPQLADASGFGPPFQQPLKQLSDIPHTHIEHHHPSHPLPSHSFQRLNGISQNDANGKATHVDLNTEKLPYFDLSSSVHSFQCEPTGKDGHTEEYCQNFCQEACAENDTCNSFSFRKNSNNNTFECNLNKNKLSSATPFYTTTPNNNNLPPNLKGKINYITYYKTNRSTYNYTEHINKFNDANNFIDISEKLLQMRTSPDLIHNQQYMKGFTVNECEELCSMVDECEKFCF